MACAAGVGTRPATATIARPEEAVHLTPPQALLCALPLPRLVARALRVTSDSHSVLSFT